MPRISYKYIIRIIALQVFFFSPLFSYHTISIHYREGLSARLARQTQELSSLLMDEENPSNIMDELMIQDTSLPTHNEDEFGID